MKILFSITKTNKQKKLTETAKIRFFRILEINQMLVTIREHLFRKNSRIF